MTTEVHDMAIAIILECSWNDEEDSEIGNRRKHHLNKLKIKSKSKQYSGTCESEPKSHPKTLGVKIQIYNQIRMQRERIVS